jgi:hypothetical protein
VFTQFYCFHFPCKVPSQNQLTETCETKYLFKRSIGIPKKRHFFRAEKQQARQKSKARQSHHFHIRKTLNLTRSRSPQTTARLPSHLYAGLSVLSKLAQSHSTSQLTAKSFSPKKKKTHNDIRWERAPANNKK